MGDILSQHFELRKQIYLKIVVWQVSAAISVELEGWTSLAAARPILNTHRNTLKIQKYTLTHVCTHTHTDTQT